MTDGLVTAPSHRSNGQGRVRESKARVALVVRHAAGLMFAMPLVSGIVILILKTTVLGGAFEELPAKDFKSFQRACVGGGSLPQAMDQAVVCNNMHKQCLMWLGKDGTAKETAAEAELHFSEAQAIQCEPQYTHFLEVAKSDVLWVPISNFLWVLAFVLLVPPCGFYGSGLDDAMLTQAFTFCAALSVPVYIWLIVVDFQWDLMINIALNGTGAYFGYVLQRLQSKPVVQPDAPAAQMRESTSQPSPGSQEAPAERY